MCNCEIFFMCTFLLLLILNIIKIIYELKKGNDEFAHKYFKYGVILLSTLTIGSYVATSDLNKTINENQKEIYQIELRTDKDSNNVVKDRLILLKENNEIMDSLSKKLSFGYYFINSLGLLILFIMMFFEKKSNIKIVEQNKNVKSSNHRK